MKIIFSDKADKQLSRLNPFIADKIIKSIRKFQNGERVDIQNKSIIANPNKKFILSSMQFFDIKTFALLEFSYRFNN